VNKTILKPRFAAATGAQYLYVGFSRRNKIPRCSAYTISDKAIRFRHPDYNSDWAQKLISSSMSRHLSTRKISSKSMHAFWSNLANRQTDRQTNTGKTFTSCFVGGNKDSNRHIAEQQQQLSYNLQVTLWERVRVTDCYIIGTVHITVN